jgi:hypothetical protein
MMSEDKRKKKVDRLDRMDFNLVSLLSVLESSNKLECLMHHANEESRRVSHIPKILNTCREPRNQPLPKPNLYDPPRV